MNFDRVVHIYQEMMNPLLFIPRLTGSKIPTPSITSLKISLILCVSFSQIAL